MEQKRKINKDSKTNSNKGITLIALVITIIVLLILSGITIATLTGENGIIKKANEAAIATEQSSLEEAVTIKKQEKEMADVIDGNGNDLGYYLRQIEGATVEELSSDAWYVTRKTAEVTVYDNGEMVTGKVDIWDGTTQEVPEFKDFNWYIYNGAQMKFFADFVNNANALTEEQKTLVAEEGYNESDITITEDTVVYLMADLDLGARQTNGTLTSGTAWTPIGNTSPYFIGTFEGNNHSVRGVYVYVEGNYAGLFDTATNTVQNLTIQDSYIEATERCVGGIVAYTTTESKILNCSNINTTIVSGMDVTGGIVGQAKGIVENCVNTGKVDAGLYNNYSQAGGVVGRATTSSTVSNCSNTGAVTGQGNNVGGVVGASNSSSTVSNCSNTGAVTGQGDDVGGVVGITFGTIEKCYNEGIVTHKGTGEGLGGICGQIGTNCTATIQNCYNKGQVIEEANNVEGIGGIVGWVSTTGTSGTISNNYNIGQIEIKGQNATKVGGIIGRIETDTFTRANNYYIEGTYKTSDNNEGESRTAQEMKEQSFVDLLNTGLTEAVWEIRSGENEGYPVIK